jgi:hypothetical protein
MSLNKKLATKNNVKEKIFFEGDNESSIKEEINKKIIDKLVEKIQKMDDDVFINWYPNVIQYGSPDLIIEDYIIDKSISDSTVNKYYKLCNNIRYSYNIKKSIYDNTSYELIQLIIEHKKYFVSIMKDYLIEQINIKFSNLSDDC